MTVTTAIIFTLSAAFLFASWYQNLKHLSDFPLSAFVFWLYIGSFITIFTSVLFLGPKDMPNGILYELNGKVPLTIGVIFGGAIMTWGLIISLIHMKENGMVANMAIMGTVGSITSLALTFFVGGLSPEFSLTLVLVAATILIIASLITQYASVLKNRDIIRKLSLDKEKTEYIGGIEIDVEKDEVKDHLKQNLMLIVSNLLLMGYSVAYIFGTRSPLKPNGFPPILCVLLLVIGSLFGAIVYSLISLKRTNELDKLFNPKYKKQIALSLISGVCHYGGNLLTIYSLPLLSAPVSMLLSRTSTIWQYFWGLLYGEFKGSSHKAKWILAGGILVYVFGTLLLTKGLY